jgi:hypothetical protein
MIARTHPNLRLQPILKLTFTGWGRFDYMGTSVQLLRVSIQKTLVLVFKPRDSGSVGLVVSDDNSHHCF